MIESSRLFILPFQFSDASELARAVRDSLPELSLWQPWAEADYGIRHSQDFIAASSKGQLDKTTMNYAIKRKDGRLIGSINLQPKPDMFGRVIPAYEIGYWIRSSDTSHGYATEAVQRLARYAFEEGAAHRVSIRCHSSNAASVRVAQKAGFELEARLRNTRRNPDDSLADTLIFAQVR